MYVPMTDPCPEIKVCGVCGSELEKLTQDVFPPIFNVSCHTCGWRVRGRDAAEVTVAVKVANVTGESSSVLKKDGSE